MEPGYENNRLENAISGIASYLRKRLDAIKLDTVEELSKLCTGVIGLLVLVMLGAIGLLMLMGVMTYLIGIAIGSFVWAIVIVAVALIAVGVIMFLLRNNLFGNAMVRMFSEMFFKVRDNREGGMYE